VAPWIVVFAAVINGIDMKADAQKMLFNTRRPRSLAAKDIGIWYNIFELLGFASIVTNVALIGYTTELFDTHPFNFTGERKLMTILLVEHALLVLKLSLAWIVDDVPAWVHSTMAYQHYVRNFQGVGRVTKLIDTAKSWELAVKSNPPEGPSKSHMKRFKANERKASMNTLLGLDQKGFRRLNITEKWWMQMPVALGGKARDTEC